MSLPLSEYGPQNTIYIIIDLFDVSLREDFHRHCYGTLNLIA